MGCVSSKTDINELHPNIFQVMNVDEMGQLRSPGQLEITETELVLHQRGKQPTRWPLRCLRKYGFDSEIFSFESGRRCPTGSGIYAFRCRKAEQLFNMLQQNIQLRNLSDETPVTAGTGILGEFPVPIVSTGPPVHRRIPSQSDSYLNPNGNSIRATHSASRPNSLTSNGPVSPPVLTNSSPPFSDISIERNNNKRDSLHVEHSYTNTNALLEDGINLPAYVNINTAPPILPTENYVNVPDTTRLYMNVTCDNLPVNTKAVSITERPADVDLDIKHCYANIDTEQIPLRDTTNGTSVELLPQSVPQTPTYPYITVREVNYAELDLVPGKITSAPAQVTLDSPSKVKKSYVTIDFNKTNALSQSINTKIDENDGSRKTRHNSTIDDVPTRHSNSLSD